MPSSNYMKPNVLLKRGGNQGTKEQGRELQRDLRRLGYLKSGIDGVFGKGTERAMKSLQHDLLHNGGSSTRGDGNAPVGVLEYNKGRVLEVTGVVDQPLVECIADMLADTKFLKLPHAEDSSEENRKYRSELKGMVSTEAPLPFILAILKQESGLKHFNEPGKGGRRHLYCSWPGLQFYATPYHNLSWLWGGTIHPFSSSAYLGGSEGFYARSFQKPSQGNKRAQK